jgi:hypothetical protein
MTQTMVILVMDLKWLTTTLVDANCLSLATPSGQAATWAFFTGHGGYYNALNVEV